MNGGDDDRDIVRRVLGTVTRTFRLVSPMTYTVDDEPKVAIDPTQYWRPQVREAAAFESSPESRMKDGPKLEI